MKFDFENGNTPRFDKLTAAQQIKQPNEVKLRFGYAVSNGNLDHAPDNEDDEDYQDDE